MTDPDHGATAGLLYGAAFGLILVAGVFLATALFTDGGGASLPLVALVASCGGLLLLAVGVFRGRGSARRAA